MSRRPSDHWQTFTGPADRFRIRHPASWRLEESAEGTRLIAPGEACTLTLTAARTPDVGPDHVEAAAEAQKLFPRQRNVRRGVPLDVESPSFCLEGEAFVGAKSAWWKRLLAPGDWRRWRMWVLRAGGVCLSATLLSGRTPDREMETVAMMILGTVTFLDDPAFDDLSLEDASLDDPAGPGTAASALAGRYPPAEFADRVVRLARKRFPLIDCRQVDEFQIRFGSSNVNLFNFYRAFVGSPESFEQIVLPALTTVVQMQELGSDQTAPPLDRVRERIMPMLYPHSLWQTSFPNFVGLEWVAGLAVLYVVDESHAYWYIRDELLEGWQIDADRLHRLALENLEAYFQKHTMQLAVSAEEAGPRLVMPHNPDAYNTARLISPDFHAKMRELLGGDLAVGVPSRDFFVAFSLDSPETTEMIRQKVAEDFTTMDHPLSERLLFVTVDGVSEYCSDWTS